MEVKFIEWSVDENDVLRKMTSGPLIQIETDIAINNFFLN